MRIEHRLEPLVQREQRRRQRLEHADAPCRRRETASHGRRCAAAHARSVAASTRRLGGEPAQRAAPFDELLAAEVACTAPSSAPTAATAARRRCARRRRTDASGRARCARRRRRRRASLAAELRAPRPTAGSRAGQPHRQPPVVVARRRQRQRLAAPLVDAPDRLVGRAFEHAASPRRAAAAGT